MSIHKKEHDIIHHIHQQLFTLLGSEVVLQRMLGWIECTILFHLVCCLDSLLSRCHFKSSLYGLIALSMIKFSCFPPFYLTKLLVHVQVMGDDHCLLSHPSLMSVHKLHFSTMILRLIRVVLCYRLSNMLMGRWLLT